MSSKGIRLDKWLWAARFYKTRSLATEAIKGGRVHVNGHRVKPSRVVEVGQFLSINKSPQRFVVEVMALSEQRQAFSIAQHLYRETQESIQRREDEAVMRQLANQAMPYERGRPTKRNRRRIIQFTQKEQ